MAAATRIILFDFDGVIVDSVPLKTEAFVALYPEATPEQHDYIRSYQLRHGGVSRVHKIAHYEEFLYGEAPTQAYVTERTGEYARLVEDAVVGCAYLTGATDFLEEQATRLSLYLVSGTPTDELRRIAARRGIAGWFKDVIGSPPDKYTTFSAILRAEDAGPEEALAVGDSITEYDAAQALGIPFVGVVAPGAPSPFPPTVPVVEDLRYLRAHIRERQEEPAPPAAS